MIINHDIDHDNYLKITSNNHEVRLTVINQPFSH